MPLPKARILYLIEHDRLTIDPFDEQHLNAYGYNVHIGEKIMLAEIENGTNTTIDASAGLKYTTYDIPDTGFVLDPTKLYYFPLKETIKTDDYAIEIVPNSSLVQAGLSIGLSVTPIPGAEFATTVSVTVTQPLKIYKDYNIANARFTLTDDGGGISSGMIVAFSGSEVPYGWLLCDGTNGTPDLRNRFILGARTTNVGETGGEAQSVLEIANLPSVPSMASAGIAAAALLSDGETVEALAPYTDYLQASAYPSGENAPDDPSGTPDTYEIPMYKSGESHTVEIDTSGDSGGGGGGEIIGGNAEPFTNMPPYYALMFIMKS